MTIELPLLLEYGQYVWPGAVLVLVMMLFSVVRTVRRSAEKRRVAIELEARTSAVTAPVLARAEGTVVVSGVLRGGTATTLKAARELHARAGDLWIDYRGERIELSSTVRVALGSHTVMAWRPPSGTPQSILDQKPRAPGHLHRLSRVQDGDTVIASGAIAGTGGVDRFGVRKWLLQPESGMEAIELASAAPQVTAPPLRWLTRLALFATFAGAASVGLYAVGRVLVDRASQTSPGAAKLSPPLSRFDPLVISAALPGTRAAALEELGRQLDTRYEQTDEVRALRAHVAQLLARWSH